MKTLAAKTQGSAGPVRKPSRRVVSPMRAGQRIQRAEIRNILREPAPQGKLPIGPSGDKYEREADAVAERVLRMPEPPGVAETDEHEEETGERSVRRDSLAESGGAPDEEATVPRIRRAESTDEDAELEPVEEQVQRQAMAESAPDEGLEDVGHAPELGTVGAEEAAGGEDEEEPSDRLGVQLKPTNGIGPHVSRPDVAARITSPSSGRPLPSRVRGFMEPRMGYRFAQVRLHDNFQDQADAASLKARAFTYRDHIWLGKGQSVDDRRLMAHELAHVVQQRAAVQRRMLDESEPKAPATEPETEKKTFFGRLKKLVGGVVEKAKDLGGAAKRALLEKLAGWAHKIPGFHLLTVVLGRNPVTGEAVERTAVTFIGAFLGLVPGGERLFENLQRSGAIERAFAWLKDQIVTLNLTWNTIRALFQRFFASLSVGDVANPPGVIDKLKRIFGPPIVRIRNFASAVGRKVFEFIFAGVLSKAGGFGEKIMAVIRKAGNVFHLIVSDPVGFLKNLLKAVQQGFMQFMGNIWSHLKTGLLGWLFGALQNAGLKLPEKFDFKGILSIVLQVLGLTYAYLRKKLVKLIGEKRVRSLEQAFEFVKILVTKGLMAAWNKLLEYMGSLWDTVIGAIRGWVVTKIIKGAITKLATMFNPVGAIIQAIMTVYNTIAFFVERINQIRALANAVFDSIANIALGKLTAAANYVENTMARTVPVIIGFLARLIGLGGISERIKGIIKGIQARVDEAIDKVIGFIVKKAKGLFGKAKAFGAEVGRRVSQWWRGERRFTAANGTPHRLYIQRQGSNARLMIASEPTPFTRYIDSLNRPDNEKAQARNIAKQLDQKIAEASRTPNNQPVQSSGATPAPDYAAEIENLLAQLVAATAPLENQPVEQNPLTLERIQGIPEYASKFNRVTFGTGTLSLASGASSQVGTSMQVSYLTESNAPNGSDNTGPVQNSIYGFGKLPQRGAFGGAGYRSRQVYIKGHLLNNHLGGPAQNNNLYPITARANSRHHSQVERHLKSMVLTASPKLVMMYNVRVINQSSPTRVDVTGDKSCTYEYINAVFSCSYATYRISADNRISMNSPTSKNIESVFDESGFISGVRGKACPQQ